MGDTKRKSETEMENAEEKKKMKIQELRDDLFREAAEIVSDFPSSKIAIFIAPPFSESKQVSMHCFGYSSAEPVLQPNSLEEKCPVPVTEDTKEDDANEEDGDDVDDDDDEEEEIEVDERSSKRLWWKDGKPYLWASQEELDDMRDSLVRARDRMSLRLEALRAQASENQEDEKVEPKP